MAPTTYSFVSLLSYHTWKVGLSLVLTDTSTYEDGQLRVLAREPTLPYRGSDTTVAVGTLYRCPPLSSPSPSPSSCDSHKRKRPRPRGKGRSHFLVLVPNIACVTHTVKRQLLQLREQLSDRSEPGTTRLARARPGVCQATGGCKFGIRGGQPQVGAIVVSGTQPAIAAGA